MSTGLAPDRPLISAVSIDELRARLDGLIEEAYEHAAHSLAADPTSYIAGVDVGMWQAYEEVRDILNGQVRGSVGHA